MPRERLLQLSPATSASARPPRAFSPPPVCVRVRPRVGRRPPLAAVAAVAAVVAAVVGVAAVAVLPRGNGSGGGGRGLEVCGRQYASRKYAYA